MGAEMNGLAGMIVLALNIWAILSIAQSDTETLAKVVWIMTVLALPLIGFFIWLLFGPRAPRR